MRPKAVLSDDITSTLQKHEVRAARMTAAELSFHLKVTLNNLPAEIVNVSESGVAVSVESEIDGRIGIMPLTLKMDTGETLYDGGGRIAWRSEHAGKKVYGIALRTGHLGENMLEALLKMNEIRSETNEQQRLLSLLPGTYRLFILELRCYLSDLKGKLDGLERSIHITSQDTKDSYSKACEVLLASDVVPRLVEFGRRLHESVAPLKKSGLYDAAKSFFRRELHDFYKSSPFVSRAWEKPLGYAGDYEMMNQIYRNELEGGSLFAKLMHKWGINEPSSISVRFRRNYLRQWIELAGKESQHPVIGSVACGPAREVIDFLEHCPENLANRFTFVLMDQDREALLNAKRNIVDVLLRRQLETQVIYLPLSVKDILEGTEVGEKVGKMQFDLIYTAGLYDYLKQSVAKMLSKEFMAWVRPGGRLIIGNFHPSNPSNTIGDFAGEWSLIHRGEVEMLDLVPDTATASKALRTDDQGIDIFLEVTKPK